jgi:hypothetical protein
MICKNDNMFYVHGIFITNGMKIKEIEALEHIHMKNALYKCNSLIH